MVGKVNNLDQAKNLSHYLLLELTFRSTTAEQKW